MTDFEIKRHGNDFTVVPIKILTELEQAHRTIDAQQALIDALMFEYCPGDMTQEQIDNWAKHQRVINAYIDR